MFWKIWRILKLEKYQRVILGASSPDSLATLENKFGRTLSWFVWVFLKSQLKKAVFWSEKGNVYQDFGCSKVPDFVAILEKTFGNKFSGFYIFFFKIQPKKVDFWSK